MALAGVITRPTLTLKHTPFVFTPYITAFIHSRAFLLVGALTLFGVCLGFAWVTEDAFITLRVVDNFVHGYGLTWNVTERVQAYTHPLWLMALTPVYAVLREPFATTILVSVVCLAVAIGVVAWHLRKTPFAFVFGFVVPLAFSPSMQEFAIGGLENPLSFMLLALFVVMVIKEYPVIPWHRYGLLLALLMLNRMDTVLLTIPFFIYLFWQHGRAIRWLELIRGFLPFIVWECFSLFYYGFLFPNTKYSKMNTGLPFADKWKQGLEYGKDFITQDIAAAIPILVVLLVSIVLLARRKTRTDQNLRLVALVAGIVLYTLYVFSVGGDYMSGRFFTLQAFVAAFIYALVLARLMQSGWGLPKLSIFASIWVLLAPLHIHMHEFHPGIMPNGIVSERSYYRMTHTLFGGCQEGISKFRFFSKKKCHYEPMWIQNARKVRVRTRSIATTTENPLIHVEINWLAGLIPYLAGPEVYFLNVHGLTEPLLARLPIQPGPWRIGHFARNVPGYYLALIWQNMRPLEKDLQGYYEPLRFIVSGPLFSWRRIKTIILFNLGYYDDYRERYIRKHPELYIQEK
ncbi:MAG: hypothetical protein KDD76_03315 [Rickettsiales bacterium]|nr:hypothetical protein [Rickettsiales bacterium]